MKACCLFRASIRCITNRSVIRMESPWYSFMEVLAQVSFPTIVVISTRLHIELFCLIKGARAGALRMQNSRKTQLGTWSRISSDCGHILEFKDGWYLADRGAVRWRLPTLKHILRVSASWFFAASSFAGKKRLTGF